MVDRISDIVEESLSVKRVATEGGILGSAVIGDQVTDLLDVHAIIQQSDPFFFHNQDLSFN